MNFPHIAQRTNLVVIASSPLERIVDFARGRGWRNLLLLSSAGNSYNRHYHGEDAEGIPGSSTSAARAGR
jgi:predicted dithiol-disulfide oxidoreductase (DUF899 family)